MSVEIWDGDELLGLASEPIGEYIESLEARIEEVERVPKQAVALEAYEQRAVVTERRIYRLHRWLRETRSQLDAACMLLDEEDPDGR